MQANHFSCFWANRPFELAEIKLLVDAIQSARFLTAKKSVQLIGKLETLDSGWCRSRAVRRRWPGWLPPHSCSYW
jgi:hypothetical protein